MTLFVISAVLLFVFLQKPPSPPFSPQKKKTPHTVILAGRAGKNRRERFFASEASPKGAYQG